MGALLQVDSFIYLFIFEQGAFSVKYSFETESEVNFLSNPYSKMAPYADSIRNLSWDLNYLTVSVAENQGAKQHLEEKL